ncbi:MAG TPA: penicillin-binding protein 2 [Gemmatimonadaceae bacterium]|nr:penicillin-binding protein 2 [Gemmatimonadaceae bacterium]
MSFHPNDIQQRGRIAAGFVSLVVGVLAAAFFRTQVLDYQRYAMQSEKNRLREVPLPAPRGPILDRHGYIIAENIPGYTVSLFPASSDSLRSELRRMAALVPLDSSDIEQIVRRHRQDPVRPAVVLSNATFDQVSVLEEHRSEFPSLVIQTAPRRYYPDGPAVAAIVGYIGEISDAELSSPVFRDAGYRAGQQVGKAGLEKQYELSLRGREGSRFVEVDARGRVVREQGARPDLEPLPGAALRTNIDLDLQRFVAALFGDTLQGAAVAMDPTTGEVLALHSSPSYDPNRFVGGVPAAYYRQLLSDPRRPLYNKAIQGKYPPASTFKLATAVVAMQEGLVSLDERMPVPCRGGYMFGTRYFRCWEKRGHGALTLAEAIEKSCDTYFYQLGLRVTLARLVAGGIALGFLEKSGIDLPSEVAPDWPRDASDYFNRKYGPRGWTNAVTLNLAIGQGENAQTLINMTRFYTALATDGYLAVPRIVHDSVRRERVLALDSKQFTELREALFGVVSSRGTAASAAVRGVEIAGKTGTAQNPHGRDHAWFVGFAPKDKPEIVVGVFVEFGEHGYFAARLASRIVAHYLKRPAIVPVNTLGG